MSKLILSVFCVFLLSLSLAAQEPKKNIFTDTAKQYTIFSDALKLFESAKKKDIIKIKLSDGLEIKAAINMNEWNDAETHTIGSKLIDYDETYLTISFYKTKNETVITGEIFSKIEKMGFRISSDSKGNIYFKKVESNKIIVE